MKADATEDPMTDTKNSDAKNDESGADGKLKRKEYEQELARLHVEFVKLQQWVVQKGFKVCILFEGRDGAGKGGTIKAMTERVKPTHLPGGRASRTNRAREVADVRPTLNSTFARGWGGHDLRPQLVQPCRRRAGDGVLHRGAGQALSADDPWGRENHRRRRDHSTEILAGGQSRGG